MGYWTDGIARVRVRPLALDTVAGAAAAPAGAAEVTWDATADGRWHQIYVNGQLAGVTARPEDRRLAASAPVGRDGALLPLLVEVIAVDATDRWTDFSDELTGFEESEGARVRLTWQAGPYLDPDLESFDVFADGRTGQIDYTAPLNEAPIPARPGGETPWGYGCGGYGIGAYGVGAARYGWTTDVLEPGAWRFAVVAVDAAGNRPATAAELACDVAPMPQPPGDFRVASYDPGTARATLAWEPSPDV